MEEGEERREETWLGREKRKVVLDRGRNTYGLNVTIRLKVIKGSH